jgi:glycosyltransferase involved in cell wall biosynthesis
LPRAARNAEVVLTDSGHSQKDLATYLGISFAKSRVIACGVDARFRAIPASEGRHAVLARYGIHLPYLLYVGAVNGRKNIDRLLAAFAQIRTWYPRLSLVVAGNRQWGATPIDAALRRLDLRDQVQFLGYVEDADLPALYSGARAFVFPSLYEGFGLPVLEAMACGTPTIASRSSSIPEVVGDAAILVDPFDVSAIAEGIEQVLGNPDLAAELRGRGVARARSFTWDRAARETLDAYQEVLDGGDFSRRN